MKIHIIKNNISYPVDVAPFVDWFNKKVGLPLEISTQTTNLTNRYKLLGHFWNRDFWDLDGIKDELRPLVTTKADVYVYVYDASDGQQGLANYTYGNDLNGGAMIVMPLTQGIEFSFTNSITHEICHALNKLLAWKGASVLDDMDTNSTGDDDIWSLTGNRERNLTRMRPYFYKFQPVAPIVDAIVDLFISQKRKTALHLAKVALNELTGASTLQPELFAKYQALITRMSFLGKPVKLVEGFRTAKRQNDLYMKVPKVTNAKGLESYHQFGLAFDLIFVVTGYNAPQSDWQLLGAEGKKLGLGWGGDFNFPDLGHFELQLATWQNLLPYFS